MNGYTIALLTREADEARLQEFLERCSDYYVLHEGWATPQDAAEYELTALPEGRSSDDLQVLGMVSESGRLVAVAELLRHYPAIGEWWLSVLLVEPSMRGRGAGPQLLDHAIEIVRAEGGGSLLLAVSLRNPRAMRFWQRVGFVDTHQLRRVAARSGHVDEVRILSREVSGGAAAR